MIPELALGACSHVVHEATDPNPIIDPDALQMWGSSEMAGSCRHPWGFHLIFVTCIARPSCMVTAKTVALQSSPLGYGTWKLLKLLVIS